MRVLVLQHIACEPPAVYEDVLLARGWAVVRVELDEGESLPGREAFDAIIAMGGPMGAYDEAEHPWLVKEKRLIAEAVRDGVPFFGACLGVQLLASALGADVRPGPEPEVGVLPVELTPEGRADPLLAGLPASFPAFQWHGDTFVLPDGAVRLFGSSAYANQGFRFGACAYGVQFHLEVDEELAALWAEVPAYRAAADATLGPGGLDRLLADFRHHAPEMQGYARSLFAAWCALAEQHANARIAAVT
ncbi:MAG: type 1 glutamine amidotransferase [Thermoleophilia bacterium]|nr:type 1 glutamine amidotransferase [Thermoleophilia bacterium]